MKYQSLLFGLLGVLLSVSTQAKAPPISEAYAVKVIRTFLKNQPLYWSPVQLPVQIERRSKTRVAKQLDILFKFQALQRKKGKKWVDATNLSEKRKRIALYWDYHLDNEGHASGLQYGTANLKRLLSLSEVKNYSGEFYVQAHISWFVDNMPDWAKRPEFHSVRLLRRSKESFSRPFEKNLYLHYENNRWVVWTPKAN